MGANTLRNKQVYSILEGPQGQLFVATDKGLYASINTRFNKVPGHPQQWGTELFNLTTDSKGNIYCNNLGGQVFRLKAGRLQLVYEHPKDRLGEDFSYLINAEDKLVVSTDNRVLYNATAEVPKTFTFPGHEVKGLSDHNGRVLLHLPVQDSLYLLEKGQLSSIPLPRPLDRSHSYWKHFRISQRSFIINSDGDFHQLGGSPMFFAARAVEREAYVQLNDTLILARGIDAGFRLLTLQGDSLKSSGYYLEETFISAAINPSQGGLLLGTFGDGLWWVPDLNTKTFTLQAEKNITGIAATHHGRVYYATRAGKLYRFYEGDCRLIHQHPGSSLPAVYVLQQNQGDTHSEFPELLYNVPGSKKPYGTLKAIWEAGPNYLLVAASRGVFLKGTPKYQARWEATGHKDIYSLKDVNTRCLAVAYLEHTEQLVFSSNNGTFLVNKNGRQQALRYKQQPVTANSLATTDNELLIATPTDGLLVYRSDSVRPFTTNRPLKGKYIIKLKVMGDDLYVHHDRGLQIVNLSTKTVRDMGYPEGVGSKTIEDMAVTEEQLWILSEKELITIPRHKGSATAPANIHYSLDSVTVNGETFSLQQPRQFSYHQSKFTFFVHLSTYLLHNETELLYRMKGLETDWEVLQPVQQKIVYRSVPPGSYTFETKLRYRGDSTAVQSFAFGIARPYWNQWWFYLLVGAAFSLLILLAALYQIRKIRAAARRRAQQQAIEKQMVESELKALRAQMNPHFIFNSLSSIQNLILQQETEKSYDYITIFSKLVRSSLNYSGQERISIADEIEFLTNYLKLENLRFNEELDFDIEYTGPATLKIPTMLVQPFVENALIHGLLKKEGQRVLRVRFVAEDNHILCEVQDNGIGRKKAEELKRKQQTGHESFSTAAIEKRMDYLSKKPGRTASFEIIDRHDDNGRASGTLVKLFIPYSKTGHGKG